MTSRWSRGPKKIDTVEHGVDIDCVDQQIWVRYNHVFSDILRMVRMPPSSYVAHALLRAAFTLM